MTISVSRALVLGAAVLAIGLVCAAARPQSAYACASEAPCDSGTETVLCPFDGTSGTGTATFNIPKDARDVTFKIVDATTGHEYSELSPICAGTTMSVGSNRTPGSAEDTFTVSYTINNVSGGGDPAEQHDVKVIAEWKRQTDLGVTKELFGLQDGEIGTDDEITFLVTITNYGPAALAGEALMFDGARTLGQAPTQRGCTMLRVEQLEGPKVNGLTIGTAGKDTVDAGFSTLPVGESIVIAVTCKPNQGAGEYLNNAFVILHTDRRYEPDPDPHADSGTVRFTVKAAADSKIEKAGAKGVSGTASPPSAGQRAARAAPAAATLEQVDVGILRLSHGVEGFEGQLAARQVRRAAACEWVKNAKGTTRKIAANDGVCDQPVWLRTNGVERWKLSLKKELPPGKYVVYSRAVDSDGAAESNFTAEDGNLKAFKVR
jgi:hypothetical protein